MFIIGIVLIIIGAAFLLKNLGILPGGMWGIIWPLGLIVAGGYIFVKRRKRRDMLEKLRERFGRRREVPKG